MSSLRDRIDMPFQGSCLPKTGALKTARLEKSSKLLERRPSEVVLYGPNFEVTAGHLVAHAQRAANDIPLDAAVVNVCNDRFAFLTGLLAAIIRGQPVLLPANRSPVTVQSLMDLYPRTCLVHDFNAMPELDIRHEVCLSIHPDNLIESEPFPLVSDDQVCVIAFTSGSTALPKANRKLWRTLREGTHINAGPIFGLERGEATIVATVPPQHMYGLETSILAPLFLPVRVSTGRPFFPSDVAAQLEAALPPRLLVTTPIHMRALRNAGISLPPVERVISATAPLSPDLAHWAEATFATEVIEVYGCTETGCLATRRCAREEPWRLFQEFRLNVEAGVGTISGNHLEESVRLEDVLELKPDGRFQIVGRSSDLVNVAGKRGSLAELTMRLHEVPGVRDAVVFVPPSEDHSELDRLCGLVVCDRPVQDVLGDFALSVDPVFLPRPLIGVTSLPRSETGKLDKGALHAMWAEVRPDK